MLFLDKLRTGQVSKEQARDMLGRLAMASHMTGGKGFRAFSAKAGLVRNRTWIDEVQEFVEGEPLPGFTPGRRGPISDRKPEASK